MMLKQDADNFLEELRKVLLDLRVSRHESQSDFAKKSNLHQSAIARIESATSPNVGIKTLYEIAKANDVSLGTLIKKAEIFENQDEWSEINVKVDLLNSKKKKWLSRIVTDILQEDYK